MNPKSIEALTPFSATNQPANRGRTRLEFRIRERLLNHNAPRNPEEKELDELIDGLLSVAKPHEVEEVQETTTTIIQGKGEDRVELPGIERKVTKRKEVDVSAVTALFGNAFSKPNVDLDTAGPGLTIRVVTGMPKNLFDLKKPRTQETQPVATIEKSTPVPIINARRPGH